MSFFKRTFNSCGNMIFLFSGGWGISTGKRHISFFMFFPSNFIYIFLGPQRMPRLEGTIIFSFFQGEPKF